MRLWRYVIVSDAGSAPNYEPPFTTLAICKPKIRTGAQPGDFVMAFAGRTLSPDPDLVVWAGVVAQKLSFEDYWTDRRFVGKRPSHSRTPDNIYEPGPHGLVQVENGVHDQRHVERDVGGRLVLVLDPAWQLDPASSSLPEQFADLRLPSNARRGHRVREVDPALASELSAWCESRAQRQASVARSGNRCRPS